MREYFLLDPSVTFLNHGSFGATPIPVFEEYQRLQRQLEYQPVEFLARRYDTLMDEARASLAKFLNTPTNDLVFIPNTTYGVNTIVHALELGSGDEVLTTDHEYGACNKAWEYYAERKHFIYKKAGIPTPLHSWDATIESMVGAINENTKCIYLSHITSETAVTLPIQQLCKTARQNGILTVIDGAHAPGQIPVDLREIGADVYIGNCHKWLCAPKGSAFMVVKPAMQQAVHPLVISWGWSSAQTGSGEFANWHQWTGTRDPSAQLAIPTAIAFREQFDWESLTQDCHDLLIALGSEIQSITGLPAIADPRYWHQMAAFELPKNIDPIALKAKLYYDYRIEVPIHNWHGKNLIRVSIQVYNNEQDCQRLISALQKLL